MANYFARKAGNINATDVWATTPSGTASDVWSTFTSADVLHSNNFAITVNVSTTVGAVRNDNANGATGGGSFTLVNGVTLTANVFSGTAGSCLVFNSISPNSATLVGDCTNTANGVAAAINSSTGTLAITGNVTAGAGGSSFGASNTSTGTLTITGNVIGGSGLNSHGANNALTGTLTITGNVNAGSSTGVGAFNNSTGLLSVIGTIQSSSTAPGVAGTNVQQTTILSGPFLTEAVRGVVPVYCAAWRWNASPSNSTYMEVMTNTFGAKRNLYTADNITGMPDEADVKDGVTYGPANELTGSMGYTLSPSVNEIRDAVWGSLTSSLTTAGSIGERLTNAPTVPSASAIASQVRTELGIELGRIDQPISSRLAAADYTAPTAAPSVVAIRQEMDANSTKLANLDASVSSRLADADYTAPTSAPTVADIRAELATELGRIDASISSRLADADYVAPTTPPTAAEIATAVEGSLLNEADGQAVLNAIVGAIGNTNLSEVSLVAAVRSDLERAGGKLDSIPTTSAPSASTVAGAVRTELGTELGRIDAAVSTRLASADYTAPTAAPTAAQNASAVRTELSTELARIDAPISGAAAPSAATVASAVRTELSTELGRVDAAVSTRLASTAATELAAVKAKTDLLNTERLANVPTVNILGTLLAQANS